MEISLKKLRILDGTAIKFIALASMVIDHLGEGFFPGQIWMRCVGRMAMPVFAFFIAEGFCYTRDRKRYLFTLLLFGIISEVPFDLFSAGKVLAFGHQNILLTFAWAVTGLICCEKLIEKCSSGKLIIAAVLVGFMAGAVIMRLDYDMLAVALISVFWLLRTRGLLIRSTVAAGVYAVFRNVGRAWFGLLGFIPICFYNGERGRGCKWLVYVFYPGHMLLIYIIKRLIMK